MIAGCRDSAPNSITIDGGNPLEEAAVEANLVDDPNATSTVGLYERGHPLGTDRLCITGDAEDALSFGVVAVFGSALTCEGRGTAEHDGTRLRLQFADADCAIDVAYDGRSLRFPGTVPDGCAAICGPRASLSGVALRRTGWDAAAARRAVGHRPPGAEAGASRICA
jgi:hypothetical protein